MSYEAAQMNYDNNEFDDDYGFITLVDDDNENDYNDIDNNISFAINWQNSKYRSSNVIDKSIEFIDDDIEGNIITHDDEEEYNDGEIKLIDDYEPQEQSSNGFTATFEFTFGNNESNNENIDIPLMFWNDDHTFYYSTAVIDPTITLISDSDAEDYNEVD